MKILIIGFDPHDIGGIQNYTRPLAVNFAKLGHKVFYFYSGAWNKRYNWLMMPYLKNNKKDFPFECVEVINPANWIVNSGKPLLDINASGIEKLFAKYINNIKPDVMHVHSLIGLPSSIIEIAFSRGIKIFNTVHEYGMLCQKRVMIDRDGLSCIGPADLKKCADCVGYLNIEKLKFASRINNASKGLLKFAVCMKQKFDKARQKYKKPVAKDLLTQFQKRLEYMIGLMNNNIFINICVSEDVKNTLMRYGVKENKLLVQHIGSIIAENQKLAGHQLHNPIVIGNIGGIGHYKGTHILLNAVSKLKRNDFILKIFGGYYDENYMKGITKNKEHLPIKFFGRYNHDDLPGILNQIDIMVLPAICNDTAPQTIFESYSARIPIIASNIGGFPDFIKDGVNGRLFKPQDSQDLADKLDEILKNPQDIERFSSNIPKLKTIKENAKELLSLYA